MKKLLTLTFAAGLMATAFSLSAQSKTPSIIVTKDGREIRAEKIELGKKGDYRYNEVGDKVTKSFRKGEVKWAWIPKPKAVRNADAKFKEGNFAEAASAYKDACKEYKDLGWEVYCLFGEAKALDKNGKESDALAVLEDLLTYKKVNPKNEEQLMEAYKYLVQKYLDNKAFDKALPVAATLSESANDNVACDAFMTRGNILLAKAEVTGNKEDLKAAALAYFQAALLFPNGKNNAAAILAAYNTLTKAKDARAEKFAELLKQKHPASSEAKQLK